MDDDNKLTIDMRNISNYLKAASNYGLEVEVVTWALMAMKEDSTLSLDDAMYLGFSEWVK